MSDVCTFTQVVSITSIDDPLTSQTTIMFTEFEKRDFSVTLSERFTHPRRETVLRKAQDVIESLYDLKFKLNVGALVTVFRVPQHTRLTIAVTRALNEKIDNVLLPLENFANYPDREEPANHRNFRLTAISNLDIGGFITAETTEDRLVMQFFLDSSGSIPQGGLDFTFTLSLGPTNEEIEFSARLLAPEPPEPPDDFIAAPLEDFDVTIPSSCAQQVQICVRDHQCEDGDAIRVTVNDNVEFSGELFNEPSCFDVPVQEGENSVEMLALNGTGYKGDCLHTNENTGEIQINGGTKQSWRHQGGAGSTANLNVTIGPPGSCPSTSGGEPAPPGSMCLGHPNRPLVIARKPCGPNEGPTGTSILLGACCIDVCDEIDVGYPTCPLFGLRTPLTSETEGCQPWAHERFGYSPLPACP